VESGGPADRRPAGARPPHDTVPRMRSPLARAALALASVSTWLTLLLAGHTAGGAIHLLLLAGLALFPWRAAAA
jgi:hypothetical protein